jgi:hypothetical protein
MKLGDEGLCDEQDMRRGRCLPRIKREKEEDWRNRRQKYIGLRNSDSLGASSAHLPDLGRWAGSNCLVIHFFGY